ncbi:hypothetical protein A5789_09210 [Nocardia sp. 852002-51101_SCH5132738]|uniref:hypothetical protein n=1 Tax=Nocardia sp. 852002-51101_SCH5132738 TaxID=1834095 RepID=UPI0007EBC565|nr:hypothetical protein [Nocardia sp. 852002-51101_SCH5132738]OBA44459.1 hypothetical protein A5789_09210 [Nocardia sp. 852002-51101_SCH5132738]
MSTDPYLVVLHAHGLEVDHNPRVGVAAAGHIRNCSSQGMGRLRAWFSDDFGFESITGRPRYAANELADHILRAIGYHQPEAEYWRGVVALSMEEDPATETIPPIPADVLATIQELETEFWETH